MTSEEALEHMGYVKEIIQSEVPWTKATEAVDKAIEALEKQIPNKNEAEWKVIWNVSVEPIEKVFICSNCDKNTIASIYRRRFNYCPDCCAKMKEVSE